MPPDPAHSLPQSREKSGIGLFQLFGFGLLLLFVLILLVMVFGSVFLSE